jgi:tagatose 6-phosphate kinase
MTAAEAEQPIVCVALNPAIDKRLHVHSLKVGQVHRVTHMEATAGGKGLNVARVAKALGNPVIASGFAGGTNGCWISEVLDQAGIEHDMVTIAGETRICLNIIDELNGSSTEVLEPGPDISGVEADLFLQLWRRLCVPGRWLSLSGSLPRGLSEDFYGQLIGEARSRGAFVVLDTSGVPLEQSIHKGPHTVKPNEHEFRQWTKSDPRDEKAVRQLAARLGQDGVETVIVSLGKDGCIAAKPDGEVWLAIPPALQAVNTVGSGDAFVAGWSVANSRGMSLPDALRLATAAGAANAMTSGTGCINPEDVAQLLQQVKLVQR